LEIYILFINLDNYIIIQITKYDMNNLFRALDDATRRQILEMLGKKDMTAGEIADAFDISKPSISYHLDLLRQGELVLSIKKGQFVYYSLNTTVLDDAVKWIYSFVNHKKKVKK